jgi:agmatinase
MMMNGERTFGNIPESLAERERSAIWLLSIPYDGTSTWGKGADRGFEAFLDAADNMELYDIETDSEVYTRGIHLLQEMTGFESPEDMYERVLGRTRELLRTEKFLTFFGGEHSISIPVIQAYIEKYPDLTVLQIDAHTDLRPSYLGTPYNHACAMYQASKQVNVVQVGIRSMDVLEKEHIQPGNCFYASRIHRDPDWVDRVLERLGPRVYLSFDLDALDPSIMPATGTPEPGGLSYDQVTRLFAEVFRKREVLGFDLVELAPLAGFHAPQFLAAKLYYKMLSYRFNHV